MKTPRRRFIAGAVCPVCGVMDRLVLEISGATQLRHCVACGYRDALDSASSVEPKSRLDGALKQRSADSDASPQPVRILDPGAPDKSGG